MKQHPADLSIKEVHAALRRGSMTAVELVRAHFERIAERDDDIGAFTFIDEDGALKLAQAADSAIANQDDLGNLHGIPFAIKDVFDMAGWPVRWGSRSQYERIAKFTAPAVQSLMQAGAIPIGLVATYELATVGPDKNSLYPQPRNPWNVAHITGGSSSGSAASVSAGMVRLALGTDTGGSVRSPSSYCGVVGFKPTFGTISLDGVMPLSPSLDHVGIIATTTQDAAIGYSVFASASLPSPADLGGVRILFGRNWCGTEEAHATLREMMDAAASVLTLCGAKIDICQLPDYNEIEKAAIEIILSEEYGSHGALVESDPSLIGSMAAGSILSGKERPHERLKGARQFSSEFRVEISALLEDGDVIIVPTTMSTAPTFVAFSTDRPVWTAMRTIPFNLSGHPALSVPMGFKDGLPLGLQIIGRIGEDATVLTVGAAFEAAHRP